MIKTDVFTCCDKCQNRLLDNDWVYGYIPDINGLAIPSPQNIVYLDKDCFDKVINDFITNIKITIRDYERSTEVKKSLLVRVAEIGESFILNKLIFFNHDNKAYYYITINRVDYLIEYNKGTDSFDEYPMEYFKEYFKREFTYGRLDEVRGKLTTIIRNKSLASRAADAAYCVASKSTDCGITTIDGVTINKLSGGFGL